MKAEFPSEEWVEALVDKLNNDEQYNEIAKTWEGDIMYIVEPGGALEETVYIYTDLWHGKCRSGRMLEGRGDMKPKFIITAIFPNIVRVLTGDLNPIQAMLTRKLKVKGDMGYMMRNVPIVLDFVRCCQEVTSVIIGE
jgi:putative sterol carrier protein